MTSASWSLPTAAPAKLCEIMFQVSAGRSSDEAETECLGATYPIIGGCLLSLWGMNYRVVEAVTCHRERWEGRQRDPELADAVHVADALTSTGLAPHRYQANSPERPVGDTPEEEGRLGGEAGLGSSVGTTASPGLALVPSEEGPSGAIGLATHKSTELESAAEVCEPRHGPWTFPTSTWNVSACSDRSVCLGPATCSPRQGRNGKSRTARPHTIALLVRRLGYAADPTDRSGAGEAGPLMANLRLSRVPSRPHRSS